MKPDLPPALEPGMVALIFAPGGFFHATEFPKIRQDRFARRPRERNLISFLKLLGSVLGGLKKFSLLRFRYLLGHP